MAAQYSQEKWLAVIGQVEEELPRLSAEYNAPSLDFDVAQSIDHTLLKVDATEEQIDSLCEEAQKFEFKSVCVRLKWVKRVVHNLQGSSVVVACVVGFHQGTYSTEEKVLETKAAVEAGALEIDMVINHVLLRHKAFSEVYRDIPAVRDAGPHPVLLKVILETSQLSSSDIIAGCKIAEEAKADFVKTSTGFNGPGATRENVRLMKTVVGDRMKVKASGGIKTVNDLVGMINAGAERIGTSSGVQIIEGRKKKMLQ